MTTGFHKATPAAARLPQPWLYGLDFEDEGLNDITIGSNPCCNTAEFFAIDGLDPVRSNRLLLLLHFRHWVTLGSVGYGPQNA